jgi:hypothetical protein
VGVGVVGVNGRRRAYRGPVRGDDVPQLEPGMNVLRFFELPIRRPKTFRRCTIGMVSLYPYVKPKQIYDLGQLHGI